MTDFFIKRRDRVPSISATLIDSAGAPVDLTGATVKFVMSLSPGGGTPTLNVAAIMVSAPAGAVKYDWAVGDTAASGSYVAEWEVTYSNGKKQTFPGVGYNTISIADDLDNA
jgi:hypothetical protein